MKFKRISAASGTEFGLLVGLVAVLLIASVSSVGEKLATIFSFGEVTLNSAANDGRHPPQIQNVDAQFARPESVQSFSVIVSDADGLGGVTLTAKSLASEITAVSVSGGDGVYSVSYLPTEAVEGGLIQLIASDPTGLSSSFSVSVTAAVPVYASCLEAYNDGWAKDGAYQLDIDGTGTDFDEETYYCDMTTSGGGWTIIQNRESDTDFYQNWAAYKAGFGTYPNFWLGNDKIHALTSSPKALYVEVENDSNQVAYEAYSSFSIENEASNYRLTVAGPSGTAGDSLLYHDGMPFTTYDRDNDQASGVSCAVRYHGAWWYNKCHQSNLNGDYGNNDYATGLAWYTYGGHYEHHSMIRTKMMIR